MDNEMVVKRKNSWLGIASILLSIPFYIIVRLMFTTDHLDKFYQQNFVWAFPTIFLVLPALIIGLAIAELSQKDRNRFFTYLAVIVSIPVLIISMYRAVITIIYIIYAVIYM